MAKSTLHEYYAQLYSQEGFTESVVRTQRFLDIAEQLETHVTAKRAKILDFGGGDAALSLALPKRFQYWYFDLAETHTLVQPVKNRLRLKRGTILDCPAETFDAVAMSEVLEHVDNVGQLMHELHRILKPGGYLVITVPNAFFWVTVLFSVFKRHLEPSNEHLALYDWSHIDNIAHAHRMKLISASTRYFLYGHWYDRFFPYCDRFLSRILPNNNAQLFVVLQKPHESA